MEKKGVSFSKGEFEVVWNLQDQINHCLRKKYDNIDCYIREENFLQEAKRNQVNQESLFFYQRDTMRHDDVKEIKSKKRRQEILQYIHSEVPLQQTYKQLEIAGLKQNPKSFQEEFSSHIVEMKSSIPVEYFVMAFLIVGMGYFLYRLMF